MHQTERILLDSGNGKQGEEQPYEQGEIPETTHAGHAKSSPVSEQAAR